MAHPFRGVLEWVLAEIEWLARALEVIENTFLHCSQDFTLGDQLTHIHETSLPPGAGVPGGRFR